MIVTCVHIQVKEDKVEDFKKVTIENHSNSVKEPGNLRFDVLQDANDPCKFMLYEGYESEEAANQHRNTPHYAKWRDTVADWMAQPRNGVRYNIVAPLKREEW
jgi:(4S)-4-hydroxy-5-phosphonooxypentane-2,3-dione isomerase